MPGCEGRSGRVIVGQHEVIERLAICLFAAGHALLMGVPGLAKTLLVSKLAETMSLKFSRIQFTPDLMPMDITGTDISARHGRRPREFQFVHGPVFANIVLADEINRAPAEDAGGDARGDAGAEGHGRRQDRFASRRRSWCWPRRIPSSRKARIRCPRRSSIGSCS